MFMLDEMFQQNGILINQMGTVFFCFPFYASIFSLCQNRPGKSLVEEIKYHEMKKIGLLLINFKVSFTVTFHQEKTSYF